MEENHQDKLETKPTAPDDHQVLPPLSIEDDKELDRLRKGFRKNEKDAFNTTRNWTGFQGKTLWDWLQLLGVLAIPLVVVGATLLFGIQQAHLADLQHKNDLKIAQDNRQNDLKIADDQQQEATLKAYLDDMTTLLLDKNLRMSTPDDEIRNIAQAKTLIALRRLTDPQRKARVVQFLYGAQLIGYLSPGTTPSKPAPSIIDLFGANLRGADLGGTNLSGANLSRADLSGAQLSGADLREADLAFAELSGTDLGCNTYGGFLLCAYLHGADLFKADLRFANLMGAGLDRAYLKEADLRSADLREADLSGADLSFALLFGANLIGATLSGAQLSGVFLKGASYNAKTLHEGPSDLLPTQWPQGFDPKVAGAICVDC